MSVTKVLFLLSTLSALTEPCFCQSSQIFVGVDFEQLASRSGCVRNAAIPPTNATISAAGVPAIPDLKLPGVTISGGQVVSYADPVQTSNNVYYTLNSCAGVQPTITITFDAPASNVNMVIGQNWTFNETVQAQDDQGDNLMVQVSNNPFGQTLFLPANNIRKITLSLPASSWSQSAPSGFYIDNLQCYINESLTFADPVPELITGTGVVNDPNSLALLGTLVRAVAADGVARVVLAAAAGNVGEEMTLSVVNDQGGSSNSTQQDGGVAAIGDSPNSRQQSVRVTAQDTEQGPMAFAIYYPPTDFSRGPQDNQAGSRTIYIQVNPSAPNVPTYRKALSILRPPVVLVHDLWEGPADWDSFTPLINDSRFVVRTASYNGVLGSRISASIPVFPNSSLALARESALGLSYNAPLLLTQIAQYVNEFRSLQNAAAAQADVVAHGMGGVIVRATIQLPNYEAPESFALGNVDKLIAIGTPHLGTPLASALLRNENSCFAGILASAGEFSFASATVDGSSVSGGVGDLQGNGFGGGLSPALARIQQSGDDTAPVGLIAGVMNNSNLSGLGGTLSVAGFMRAACSGSPLASSLTASGWPGVLGDASDAMVPRTSQLSGFFGLEFSGLVHSAGMEQLSFNPPGELDAQSPMSSAVISLLNSSVRSFSFIALP